MMATLRDDQRDMSRSEFLLVKDVCKTCPISMVLSALRSCQWNVDQAIHDLLEADGSTGGDTGTRSTSTGSASCSSGSGMVCSGLSPLPAVREGSVSGRIRVIAAEERERKRLPAGFLAAPRCRLVLVHSAPSFVDFLVYLSVCPGESTGLTLAVAPSPEPGAADPASDLRSCLLLVDKVAPRSIAVEAGLMRRDRLLRLNGLLVTVSGANMDAADALDAINAAAQRGDLVVLLCRRVLDQSGYAALPPTQEQGFLRYKLEQGGGVTAATAAGATAEAEAREDMGDGGLEQGGLHPYALLFLRQEMIDQRRAAALSRVLAGIKEARVDSWEKEYLSYVALLRRTRSRALSHGQCSASGSDLASLAVLTGAGVATAAGQGSTLRQGGSSPTHSRSSSRTSRSSASAADASSPWPGALESGSGSDTEAGDTEEAQGGEFQFKKLEHSVSLPYRGSRGGAETAHDATAASLPRHLTPPPSFSPSAAAVKETVATAAAGAGVAGTGAVLGLVAPQQLPSVRFITRSVSDGDIARIASSADPVLQALLPCLRPALSVRILRSEVDKRSGATFYVVWVLDVKSGSEWLIKRRFQDFYELRKALNGIRKSLSGLPFPKKKLRLVERFIVSQRAVDLERYLRALVRIVCSVNAGMLSSLKLRVILERFLEVSTRYEKILASKSELVEAALSLSLGDGRLGTQAPAHVVSSVGGAPEQTPLQPLIEAFLGVYVQQVLAQEETESIIRAFAEEFIATQEPMRPRREAGDGEAVGATVDLTQLADLKGLLDNLQMLLYGCVIDDCCDIITVYGKYQRSDTHENESHLADTGGSSGGAEFVQQAASMDQKPPDAPERSDSAPAAGVREEAASASPRLGLRSSLKKARSHADLLEYSQASSGAGPDRLQTPPIGASSSAQSSPVGGSGSGGSTVTPLRGRSRSTAVATRELLSYLVYDTPTKTALTPSTGLRRAAHSSCINLPSLFEEEEEDARGSLVASRPSAGPGERQPQSRAKSSSFSVPASADMGGDSGYVPAVAASSASLVGDALHGGGAGADSAPALPAATTDTAEAHPESTAAAGRGGGNSSRRRRSSRLRQEVTLNFESVEQFAQNAVRRQLEAEVCSPPLCKKLRKSLQAYYAPREAQLAAKIAALYDRDQAYFGVPARFVSPSGWHDVVQAFQLIKSFGLPQQRILAFLRMIRLITMVSHLEHRRSALQLQGAAELKGDVAAWLGHAHAGGLGSRVPVGSPLREASAHGSYLPSPGRERPVGSSVGSPVDAAAVLKAKAQEDVSAEAEAEAELVVIGADDFLPILIYVVIHSRTLNLLALNAEMQALCAPSLRMSEAGYYLTTLDAALRHILDFEVAQTEPLPTDFCSDV